MMSYLRKKFTNLRLSCSSFFYLNLLCWTNKSIEIISIIPDFWIIPSFFFSSSVFMSMASGGKGSSPSSHRHTNRLASERSPYLLQHAHNPVDWWVTLHRRFLNADKIYTQTHAMFSVGIRGDKRLLTKRRMKISQSFYQVRYHSLTWWLLCASNGILSVIYAVPTCIQNFFPGFGPFVHTQMML